MAAHLEADTVADAQKIEAVLRAAGP